MEGKKTDELHLLSDTSSKHGAVPVTSETQLSAEENRNENPQGESPSPVVAVAWPPPQWSFLTPDEASWQPLLMKAVTVDHMVQGAYPQSPFSDIAIHSVGAAAPSPFGNSPISGLGAGVPSLFGIFSISDEERRNSLFEALSHGNDFSSTDQFCNSSGMELTIDEFVFVRVRGQQSSTIGENDEMMPKEEAICMVCFNKFTAEDVLMTKCKCKFVLIHEDCSKNRGKDCRICEEEIRYVPVTLLSDKQSFPTTQELDGKSSTAKRYWRMLSKKLLRRKK